MSYTKKQNFLNILFKGFSPSPKFYTPLLLIPLPFPSFALCIIILEV